MVIKSVLSKMYVLLCSLLVLVPLAVIASGFAEIDAEIWAFLLDYQLPLLVKNTLFLVGIVAFGTILLGVSTAWLTAMYRFPCRSWLFWAMMLPLTVPAYVLAFVQLGIFDYTGFLSTYLRETFGFEQGLPDIRNRWGLALVMILTFYPYVYLLARNAFMSMGQQALDIGASLGLSPTQSAIKIALPMARPWITGGVILAMMEVLADFGAVSIFGVETFTTAIYEAWFGFYSLETAKQLASLLILFVFVMIVLEQLSRGQKKFASAKSKQTTMQPLKGLKAWLATIFCLMILSLGFLIPIVQLLIWTYQNWQDDMLQALFSPIWHSVLIALIGTLVTTFIALWLVIAKRNDNSWFNVALSRVATLGYAIPGSVLAIGVFIPVAFVDNWLLEQLQLGEDVTGIIKGTLAVMVIAYLIRFLALSVSGVENGFERIRPSLTESAVSLGVVGWRLVWQVYLPLLKGALGVAMLMVFVDIMKEMPITLMTRPHDWDTLAVRIYAFTMEGQYAQAGLPALVIVLVGLLPVVLFSKMDDKR